LVTAHFIIIIIMTSICSKVCNEYFVAPIKEIREEGYYPYETELRYLFQMIGNQAMYMRDSLTISLIADQVSGGDETKKINIQRSLIGNIQAQRDTDNDKLRIKCAISSVATLSLSYLAYSLAGIPGMCAIGAARWFTR